MDAGTPAPGNVPDSTTHAGALGRLSLTELAGAVHGGALSPADLVAEALASLDRWQPLTNAASQLWPEEALAVARALRPGPYLTLPGIPVLVKESMDVAGLPPLALPAGSGATGLPLGVQLIGHPGDEWTPLRIGAAFENCAGSERKIPAMPSA